MKKTLRMLLAVTMLIANICVVMPASAAGTGVASLVLNKPAGALNGSTVTSESYTLSGTATVGNDVTIKLNGTAVATMPNIEAAAFTYPLTLVKGENKIEVTAAGASSSSPSSQTKTQVLYYKTNLVLNEKPRAVTSSSFTVTGKVLNAKSNISIRLNFSTVRVISNVLAGSTFSHTITGLNPNASNAIEVTDSTDATENERIDVYYDTRELSAYNFVPESAFTVALGTNWSGYNGAYTMLSGGNAPLTEYDASTQSVYGNTINLDANASLIQSSGGLKNGIPVRRNTVMNLTWYAKCVNNSAGYWGRMGVYSTNVYGSAPDIFNANKIADNSTTKWKRYSYTFNTGNNDLIYVGFSSKGQEFYIDNLEVSYPSLNKLDTAVQCLNDSAAELPVTGAGLAANQALGTKYTLTNNTKSPVSKTVITALYYGSTDAPVIEVLDWKTLDLGVGASSTAADTDHYTLPNVDLVNAKIKLFIWDGTTLAPFKAPVIYSN